ncbi:MAG: hypothetical protein ACI4II_05220 [Acutalibacteraceae bacterium]
MCTGFIKKGDDLLFGFNLDIDPNVWNYGLYMTKNYFTVGIKVGKTLYFTHGVNKDGHFGNVPYMNGSVDSKRKVIKNSVRIDLITDRYIRNKYSFDDVLDIVKTKTVVNIPNGSMQSLLGDAQGNILLVEPDYGYKRIDENYAVITNFPLLTTLDDYSSPFYGKDRYDRVTEVLSASDNTFSPMDGIELLRSVKCDGKWGTRISFVYSKNENCVYYCLDGDFNNIKKWPFCFNTTRLKKR